jgi:L-methionine (R)-S-oxide reductase
MKSPSEIIETAKNLIENEQDYIANAANLSALLFQALPDINWAGFYFLRGHELVLGPFQGNPACIRIALGKGVCGTAAQSKQTVIVPNVHEFSGHIACDSASNSEIVIPLLKNQFVIGVLDIDSPLFNRFSHEDKHLLEKIADIYLQHSLFYSEKF